MEILSVPSIRFKIRTGVLKKYPQEVTFVFLDLVSNVFVKEQFTQDERSHGSHVQPFCFSQNLLISGANCSTLFLLLSRKRERCLSPSGINRSV